VHNLRLILLILAVSSGVIASVLLLRSSFHREQAFSRSTQADRESKTTSMPGGLDGVEAELRAKLAVAPDYSYFFDQLKVAFPVEYQAFLRMHSRRSNSKADEPNPDILLAEATRFLRVSRGTAAAKAGLPAIQHIFELQAAMLAALAADDPSLCAEFLSASESNRFYAFSAHHRGLVAALGLAGLEAIRDGEVKQIDRAAPANEDFSDFENALRGKGLAEAEIAALLDGKTRGASISDARLCEAGQVYLETLNTLPEPMRLRIYGFAIELMARSETSSWR